MDKGKVYLVDTTTGKATYWRDINEIVDDDLSYEVTQEDLAKKELAQFSEPFTFSIERALPLEKLVDELEPERKQKLNPVFVPKHIARRRKW